MSRQTVPRVEAGKGVLVGLGYNGPGSPEPPAIIMAAKAPTVPNLRVRADLTKLMAIRELALSGCGSLMKPVQALALGSIYLLNQLSYLEEFVAKVLNELGAKLSPEGEVIGAEEAGPVQAAEAPKEVKPS